MEPTKRCYVKVYWEYVQSFFTYITKTLLFAQKEKKSRLFNKNKNVLVLYIIPNTLNFNTKYLKTYYMLGEIYIREHEFSNHLNIRLYYITT